MLMVDPVPNQFQYSDEIQQKFTATLAKLIKISGKEKHKSFNYASSGEDKTMTADAFYQQLGFDKTKK